MTDKIIKNKEEANRNKNKKGIEKTILLLLIFSLLIVSTYAWFTDSAYSKGNKFFAGTLFVDVIANEQDLVKKYNIGKDEASKLDPLDHDEIKTALESLGYKQYKRTYPIESGGTNSDYYYVITNTDAGVVNLYNLEPGQVRYVHTDYVNTGDLAFKTAGALKFNEEDSFTGLETLERQYSNEEDIFKNKYAVNEDNQINPANLDYDINNNTLTEEEYNHRKTKLINLQAIEDDNGNIELDGKKYIDNGGHLEDILEVYVLDNYKDIDRTIFTDLNSDKHKECFFGNLKQFEFLVENGPTSLNNDDNYDENGNYKLHTLEELLNEDFDDLSNDEKYMVYYNSLSANLYKDYQRYLNKAGGYCLPIDTITNNGVLASKDGVNVKVYDPKEGDYQYKASEIGGSDFIIYMPETASSIYQNASISLELGVTASQVEFEMDDTGYMIYDQFKRPNLNEEIEFSSGDLIKYMDKDNNEHDFVVIEINDNNVLMYECLFDDNSKTAYYPNESNSSTTIDFGNNNYGIKYEGSALDQACINHVNEYSNSDSPMNEFYKSLIPIGSFKQQLLSISNKCLLNYDYSFDYDDYYDRIVSYGEVVIDEDSSRLTRSLALSDIFKSFSINYDNKNIDYDKSYECYKYFFNNSDNDRYFIHLMDAYNDNSVPYSILFVNNNYGMNIGLSQTDDSISHYYCPVYRMKTDSFKQLEFTKINMPSDDDEGLNNGDLIHIDNDNHDYRIISINNESGEALLIDIDPLSENYNWGTNDSDIITDSIELSLDNSLNYSIYNYNQSNIKKALGEYFNSYLNNADEKIKKMGLSIKDCTDNIVNGDSWHTTTLSQYAIDLFKDENITSYCKASDYFNSKFDRGYDSDYVLFSSMINGYCNYLFFNDAYYELDSLNNYYMFVPSFDIIPYELGCIYMNEEELFKFFLNKDKEEISDSDTMWFMESGLPISDNQEGRLIELDNAPTNLVLSKNGFEFVSCESANSVHPCFYINLKAEGISYSKIEDSFIEFNIYKNYSFYGKVDDFDIVKIIAPNGNISNMDYIVLYSSEYDGLVLAPCGYSRKYKFFNDEESAKAGIQSQTYRQGGGMLTNIRFYNYLKSDLNQSINNDFYEDFVEDLGYDVNDDALILNKIFSQVLANHTSKCVTAPRSQYATSFTIGGNNYSYFLEINDDQNIFNFANLGLTDLADFYLRNDWYYGDFDKDAIELLYDPLKDDGEGVTYWLSTTYLDNNLRNDRLLSLTIKNNGEITINHETDYTKEYYCYPIIKLTYSLLDEYGFDVAVVKEHKN